MKKKTAVPVRRGPFHRLASRGIRQSMTPQWVSWTHWSSLRLTTHARYLSTVHGRTSRWKQWSTRFFRWGIHWVKEDRNSQSRGWKRGTKSQGRTDVDEGAERCHWAGDIGHEEPIVLAGSFIVDRYLKDLNISNKKYMLNNVKRQWEAISYSLLWTTMTWKITTNGWSIFAFIF